jgi:FixJ family two-component response regulator
MSRVPVVSIIDDDASVRVGISSLTRSLGWDAHLFASPVDFLASASSLTSTCVISDIQMPGMNGLELQRHLIQTGNSVPIIFITAFGSETIRREAMANGALCFLQKPVDSGRIVVCLEKLKNAKSDGQTGG